MLYDVNNSKITCTCNKSVIMQTCPRCAHNNRDGELVCQRCRQPLSNYTGLATRKIRVGLDFAAEQPILFTNTSPIPRNKITIELMDYGEHIVIENQTRLVIGRSSSHSARLPDVDLTPYHAFSK